jgi:hypothetical protein
MTKKRKTKKKRKKKTALPEGCHHVPPLAYDAMKATFPTLEKTVKAAVGQFRAQSDSDEARIVPPEFLLHNDDVQRFLEEFQRDSYVRLRHHPDDIVIDANILGSHLSYMINFELHHRKVFWVDEALAWMLGQTNLDIEGSLLKLPFPSFAIAFTDSDTLALGDALIALDDSIGPGTLPVKIITAHVTKHPDEGESQGMSISLLLDRRNRDWPYLLNRELEFKPTDNLDAILRSHPSDVSEAQRDPVFASEEMQRLVHLVINAVMYATSAHLEAKILKSPMRRLKRRPSSSGSWSAAIALSWATEDVFHLPGKIDISQLRRLKEIETSHDGPKIMKRFMVRGHWRKPAVNWHDQNLRWIEPYWKGPDMALAVEREYRLKV